MSKNEKIKAVKSNQNLTRRLAENLTINPITHTLTSMMTSEIPTLTSEMPTLITLQTSVIDSSPSEPSPDSEDIPTVVASSASTDVPSPSSEDSPTVVAHSASIDSKLFTHPSMRKTNPALLKEELLIFPAMKIKNARKVAHVPNLVARSSDLRIPIGQRMRVRLSLS